MTSQQFTTVLPHEPLPIPVISSGSSINGDNGTSNDQWYGYVHLQGAFVPKRKETKDGECTTTDKSSSIADRDHDDDKEQSCTCCDIRYIENTLRINLQHMLTYWGMDATDIISIEALLQESSSSSNNDIENKNSTTMDNNNYAANKSISKVRLTLSTPSKARTITARLRRGAYSSRDFLCSTIVNNSSSAEDGCEEERVTNSYTSMKMVVTNEGLCVYGCGGRYAGRPLQVTQVTPVAIVASEQQQQQQQAVMNDVVGNMENSDDSTRWARAAPPKFRRLLITTSHDTKNKLTEDELEYRRGKTRFVYVNVLTNLRLEDLTFDQQKSNCDSGYNIGGSGEEVMEMLKHNLLTVFQGRSHTKEEGTAGQFQLHHDGMVEDDIRHAFQEALRAAICRDNITESYPGESDSKVSSQSSSPPNLCHHGVELFMKSDTSGGKKSKANKKLQPQKNNGGGVDGATRMLYDHLHIGMRSNSDATKLIQSWQGRRISLQMKLPTSFLRGSATQSTHKSKVPNTISIITGKLFLDYADILLPKGRLKSGVPRNNTINSNSLPSSLDRIRGEPSRSECTSTTSHVHIPGLELIPNYVSEQEEQILLAVLTGPHAPWAPRQYTPSGGMIRRRVQHYGYVFDYESADVLRRDEEVDEKNEENNDAGEGGKRRSACPPLPSIKSTRKSVLEMTNEDVEQWVEESVRDVKGWEAMAGIVERTRRYDFASHPSSFAEKHETAENLRDKLDQVPLNTEDPLSSNSTVQTYPHINQVTINEYTPGQGIGSHVDTETAFDDGLLIITLNGGIVMEFRKVVGSDAMSNTTNEGNSSSNKNNGNTKKLVYLPPRSLVLLSGDARYKWEHMIVSRTTDTVDGQVLPRKMRVSLTLRTALTAPKAGVPAVPLPLYETTTFPPRWGQLSDAVLMKAQSKSADGSNHSADSTAKRSDLVTPDTESKHVHAVYDAIATQWHHTRGKRGVLWPGATRFLENLPKGSLVADVGCGDGKYFSAIWASNSYVIGTDISEPLLKTAAAAADESEDSNMKATDGPQYQRLSKEKRALSTYPAVAVADCIHLPLRSDSCDAAICIAVMHHLSTEGRRIRCLSELCRIVKVGGLINVQAWALEQENDSKRKFHGTDVLVPFNAQPKYLQTATTATSTEEGDKESQKVVQPSVGKESKGKGVAEMMAEKYDGADFDSKKNLVVFQRYCHMYRRGELEYLCDQVPGLEVLESSYEKGNHVVLLRVCDGALSP